jgi:hypothetical protein
MAYLDDENNKLFIFDLAEDATVTNTLAPDA